MKQTANLEGISSEDLSFPPHTPGRRAPSRDSAGETVTGQLPRPVDPAPTWNQRSLSLGVGGTRRHDPERRAGVDSSPRVPGGPGWGTPLPTCCRGPYRSHPRWRRKPSACHPNPPGHAGGSLVHSPRRLRASPGRTKCQGRAAPGSHFTYLVYQPRAGNGGRAHGRATRTCLSHRARGCWLRLPPALPTALKFNSASTTSYRPHRAGAPCEIDALTPRRLAGCRLPCNYLTAE